MSQSAFDPKELRYSESHEWAHLEGDIVTVGITDFAVEQLTDLVHVELPAVGTEVAQGEPFGEIESVKTVSELIAPVSGTVAEVNQAVQEDVTVISQDPYGQGWMIKIRVPEGTTLDHLMTYDEYQEQIGGGA